MSEDVLDVMIERLFTLLDIPTPTEGSVLLEFHEGKVNKVRPTSVYKVTREKSLARPSPPVHTLR